MRRCTWCGKLGGAIGVALCLVTASPAHGDVLLLLVGSGTRELQCVILEETADAYRVRMKIGTSTVPKARVAGVQRESEAQNAALVAEWDAAKGGGETRTPRRDAPVAEGPIPPAERTDTRTVDVPALLERYSLAELQAGFDHEAECPKGSPWCEVYVVAVGKVHRTELGLRRGDRILGVNAQRIPSGPAAEGYLAVVLQRALNGGRSTVHLIRDGERVDLRFVPPRPVAGEAG